MDNLADFFETGSAKIPHQETLSVITIRECGFKALANPGVWIEVPSF